jgi:hypothetical protein
MTIYMTPYDPDSKKCTGPSAPSGFATMDDVATVFGSAWVTRSRRTLLYAGMAFTDYVMRYEL